jgi:Immunity protein 26
MNLAVLSKSRRRPTPGDVFAMLPPGGFLFGRVIDVDANAGGFEGSNLIYIFRARSQSKSAVPPLTTSDLLIPPIMTNRLPWVRGYFELVDKGLLQLNDRLAQHCFRDALRSWYFDEKGRQLKNAVEPVGDWGLHSFRTIDDQISRALGIPLSP